MAFARISTVRFPQGNEPEGAQVLQALLETSTGQPGYIWGTTMRDVHEPNRMSRVTFWTDRHSADSVAGLGHVQYLRSRLLVLAEGGEHVEDAFDTISDDSALNRLQG